MVWKNSKNKLLMGVAASCCNRRALAKKVYVRRAYGPSLHQRSGRKNVTIYTKFAWSFWGQRIVKAFMRGGKKKTALRGFNRMLMLLRFWVVGYRRPFGVFFEAVEMIRPALYAVERKRGRRKVVVAKILPWWKQYALALRWMRHHMAAKARMHMPWALASEVRDCLTMPERSKIVAKKSAMYELATYARIYQHYRW